jgi:hypothetical protein
MPKQAISIPVHNVTATKASFFRLSSSSMWTQRKRLCPVPDLIQKLRTAPLGVFSFNPVEGWSRDVSERVAQELRRRCGLQGRDVPESIRDFVEPHDGDPPGGGLGGRGRPPQPAT